MIRGVIFDCFGVLAEGSLTYLAGLASPENREAVYDVNRSADRGYLSHEEYVRLMAELVNLTPDDVRKIFREQHIRNEPLIDFVRELRSRYKTALLSNVGHNVIDKLFTDEELTGLFDTVVLSAEVGIVKPYPEIFELTASRLGLPPEECVMIDDLPKNTEGAEMAGMKGLVYGSMRQLKTDLGRLAEVESRLA